MNPAEGHSSPSRRQALTWMGAAGLALAGVACQSRSQTAAAEGTTTTSSSTTEPASPTTTSTTAVATAKGATTTTPKSAVTPTTIPQCVLTPEMTEGPYYISGEALRSDVTEGKPGVALQLNLSIVNASTCRAIPDAVVEIWHADADGDYSGFGSTSANRTFLRGVQSADGNGLVVFKTIYPGWYRGRATHIHLKARVDGVTHTTQLFFDEAHNDAVYSQAPYSSPTGSRTPNSQDNIYAGGGSSTLVALAPSGGGYIGSLTLGVRA